MGQIDQGRLVIELKLVQSEHVLMAFIDGAVEALTSSRKVEASGSTRDWRAWARLDLASTRSLSSLAPFWKATSSKGVLELSASRKPESGRMRRFKATERDRSPVQASDATCSWFLMEWGGILTVDLSSNRESTKQTENVSRSTSS
jgi:hypothetical protein